VPGRFPRSIRSWRFRKIVPPALQRAHPLFSSQGFSILEKPAVSLTNGGAIETCPESAKADFAGTDRGFNPGADTGQTGQDLTGTLKTADRKRESLTGIHKGALVLAWDPGPGRCQFAVRGRVRRVSAGASKENHLR
jgi:hypothetical protein